MHYFDSRRPKIGEFPAYVNAKHKAVAAIPQASIQAFPDGRVTLNWWLACGSNEYKLVSTEKEHFTTLADTLDMWLTDPEGFWKHHCNYKPPEGPARAVFTNPKDNLGFTQGRQVATVDDLEF